MSLPVVCFCGYFCNNSMRWRPEDFDSYKWVQALKGRELNKYALVPVDGVKRRLSNENLGEAVIWLGIYVADYLKEQEITGPFLVVPVPNSDCVASSTKKPRTRRLAKAICDTLNDGSTVLDCLRWKKNLGSASEDGGPREAEILYRNLVILEDVLKETDCDLSVMLVDDVTTSGGHLQACASKLDTKGLGVDIVVCGGKTVYDQNNSAFHIYEYNLDEYEP
jgi:hypothetical protein